jgi:hypothetical protein
MKTYETFATVEDQGRVSLSGVPFAPGTEVEITISAKKASPQGNGSSDAALASARDRMRALFGEVRGFRNSPRIRREDLYER